MHVPLSVTFTVPPELLPSRVVAVVLSVAFCAVWLY